jgi:hypothetical protein
VLTGGKMVIFRINTFELWTRHPSSLDCNSWYSSNYTVVPYMLGRRVERANIVNNKWRNREYHRAQQSTVRYGTVYRSTFNVNNQLAVYAACPMDRAI